jgi:hypothetical protein
MRLLSGSMLALSLLVSMSALGASAQSQSFGLAGQGTHMGAGKSLSSSFAVESCVGYSPVGSSQSGSFKLQSGCGAAYLTANDLEEFSLLTFIEDVPAFSHRAIALLMLVTAMLLLAAPRIRRAAA